MGGRGAHSRVKLRRDTDAVMQPPFLDPQHAAARPTVSVLIVNYNGARFLDALLAALPAAFARHSFEVIVVDNASTDGSAQRLRDRADIVLLEPGRNTGFTGGNNLAARVARGRVLLLLNNDTLPTQPLDTLIDTALRSGNGAVGCRLQYGDGRLQRSVGLPHTPARLLLSWVGFDGRANAPAWLRRVETDARFYAGERHDVAWVSGACLATRRELWQTLGGLDESLFMYCEDVDYCERVRNAGFSVTYLPTPVVTHFEAGGKDWVGSGALLRTVRSYFILVSGSHGRRSARLLSAGLSLVFGARACAFAVLGCTATRSARRGLLFEKARGYARAASTLSRACVSGAVPALQ